MRTILLALFALMVSGGVWGQEKEFKVGDIVRSIADMEHSATNIESNEILDKNNLTVNYLESEIQFKITKIDKVNGEYWLKVYPSYVKLKCRKKDNCEEVNKKDRSLYYNDKVFKVTEEEFLAKTEFYEPIDRFSIGILNLPFKFRIQEERSFETTFNINSLLNYRIWQFYNTGFYLQAGAGFGSVKLNNNNSIGINDKAEIDAVALSFLGGAMLQYKRVQAGVYVGWDHINNQKNYQWQYNGKPWVGFGIGYELFKIDLGGESKQNKNQKN